MAECCYAMADEKRNDCQNLLDRLMDHLSGPLRIDIVGKVWKIGRKLSLRRSDQGMCEVLEYESTLELKDREESHLQETRRDSLPAGQRHRLPGSGLG